MNGGLRNAAPFLLFAASLVVSMAAACFLRSSEAATQDEARQLVHALVERQKPAAAPLSPWNDVTITPADSQGPGALRFEDYSVLQRYSGSPAKVALRTHPESSTWRTQLREGSRKGPNFADHYTIVTWGCGTDCMQIAIVDARNGTVFFPDNLGVLSFVNVHDDVFEAGVLRFRRDSRLLIAVGMPNEDASQRGVSYYEWTGRDLRLVHRVSRKW